MISPRDLKASPDTYREKEVQAIARWILAGDSGSVVGLAGCGRSNLLNFLSHRPEVLSGYLPPTLRVVVIPVDLHNLPASDASTLYRVILRSFYWVREGFEKNIRERVKSLYEQTWTINDPFVSQSALYEVLFAFRSPPTRVVLILNRFDQFFEETNARLLNTLRGLRDQFKEILSLIVGMQQDIAYLSDRESLGDVYELLDNHVCWVGAMVESDARQVIAQTTYSATKKPAELEIKQMLRFAGHFPALLNTIVRWWLQTQLPIDKWLAALRNEPRFEYRLARMWSGLSGEEQFALSAVREWQEKEAKGKDSEKALKQLNQEHAPILNKLVDKGLCIRGGKGWHIKGELLTDYIRRVGPRGKGRIRLHGEGEEIYQGLTRLHNLPPQEETLLRWLIKQPYKRHTYTVLMDAVWTEDEAGKIGITRSNLQQLVSMLRKKIEVDNSEPRYIISWRSAKEGGYQFYPEGRPE